MSRNLTVVLGNLRRDKGIPLYHSMASRCRYHLFFSPSLSTEGAHAVITTPSGRGRSVVSHQLQWHPRPKKIEVPVRNKTAQANAAGDGNCPGDASMKMEFYMKPKCAIPLPHVNVQSNTPCQRSRNWTYLPWHSPVSGCLSYRLLLLCTCVQHCAVCTPKKVTVGWDATQSGTSGTVEMQFSGRESRVDQPEPRPGTPDL